MNNQNTEINLQGSFVEENHYFKIFLHHLSPMIIEQKDKNVKEEVEKELVNQGVSLSDLTFHEGANHLEWKKNNTDFVVIERHHKTL